jgi:hypothetical protein
VRDEITLAVRISNTVSSSSHQIPVPALVEYSTNENELSIFHDYEKSEGHIFLRLTSLHIFWIQSATCPSGQIGMLALSDIPDTPTPTLGHRLQFQVN